MADTRILSGLRDIADTFDLVILDLWGCVHDGVKPYPGALDCFRALKAAGKKVAVTSNAPRRATGVIGKLAEMGIARELYDDLFSSGEETWRYLKTRPDGLAQRLGLRAYAIITDRDLDILEGLDLELVKNVPDASFVLVTGVADDKVKVSDFDEALRAAYRANLPMVCANPDLIVHRGGVEELCAGSIAERYEGLGGRVVYHGKPHRKIYEIIFKAYGIADPKRVIGIGDSFRTDVRGAQEMGAQSALIAAGIHHVELLRGGGRVDPGQVAALSKQLGVRPDYALPMLAW
jgi:HAD superfamily hydrolase (TIGR01459 family)